MTISIFTFATWLRDENNIGYGTRPIPQPRDAEISALLRAWLLLAEPLRIAALAQVSEDYRFTLLAYSERMASLAVRDHNREHLLLGLLALGLDGWRFDLRDNLLVVCLHYDAAERIGLCPNALFENAAQLLSDQPANGLRSFLHRSQQDKSLDAMGYTVTADADGFRYQRTW